MSGGGLRGGVQGELAGGDRVGQRLALQPDHSTLGAMASGVGSKLGTGRQNSSCAVAGWSSAQRPLASRPTAKASRPGSATAIAARITSSDG